MKGFKRSEMASIHEIARRLSTDMPGWERKIDTDSLNLNSVSRCIVGQLYGLGKWRPTIQRLGLPFFGRNDSGYSTHVIVLSVNRFVPAWVAVINKRRR